MPRMSIPLPPEPDSSRPPLKPFLLFTLALAVLAFSAILLGR
jgi:hypothetical protein